MQHSTSDLTNEFESRLTQLLSAWNAHQDLRSTGASLASLDGSARTLTEARNDLISWRRTASSA